MENIMSWLFKMYILLVKRKKKNLYPCITKCVETRLEGWWGGARSGRRECVFGMRLRSSEIWTRLPKKNTDPSLISHTFHPLHVCLCVCVCLEMFFITIKVQTGVIHKECFMWWVRKAHTAGACISCLLVCFYFTVRDIQDQRLQARIKRVHTASGYLHLNTRRSEDTWDLLLLFLNDTWV